MFVGFWCAGFPPALVVVAIAGLAEGASAPANWALVNILPTAMFVAVHLAFKDMARLLADFVNIFCH